MIKTYLVQLQVDYYKNAHLEIILVQYGCTWTQQVKLRDWKWEMSKRVS